MKNVELDIRSVTVIGRLHTHDVLLPRKHKKLWQTRYRGETRLSAALIFTIDDKNLGKLWFDAPQFSVTDFWSYPIRPISTPGRNLPPVGHDRLYDLPVVWSVDTGAALAISRRGADDVLDALMVPSRVAKFSRWFRYRGVRAGGWYSWRKYRKNKAVYQSVRSYAQIPQVIHGPDPFNPTVSTANDNAIMQ